MSRYLRKTKPTKPGRVVRAGPARPAPAPVGPPERSPQPRRVLQRALNGRSGPGGGRLAATGAENTAAPVSPGTHDSTTRRGRPAKAV